MSTFALIHGNWHDGSSWRAIDRTAAGPGPRGTGSRPADRRSRRRVGRSASNPFCSRCGSARGDLVIVAHSGASGTARWSRTGSIDPLLVYLCPRLTPFPAPPDAPQVFRPGFPFPQRRPDGMSAWEPRGSDRRDVPAPQPRDGRGAGRETLRPTGPPADDFPMREHPDVDTALVYASEDELFEPDWERFMARELLGVEADRDRRRSLPDGRGPGEPRRCSGAPGDQHSRRIRPTAS